MIDYLSLALGHGLLAIALLRLVMREDLDVDQRLKNIADSLDAERAAKINRGRASSRRDHIVPDERVPDERAPDEGAKL